MKPPHAMFEGTERILKPPLHSFAQNPLPPPLSPLNSFMPGSAAYQGEQFRPSPICSPAFAHAKAFASGQLPSPGTSPGQENYDRPADQNAFLKHLQGPEFPPIRPSREINSFKPPRAPFRSESLDSSNDKDDGRKTHTMSEGILSPHLHSLSRLGVSPSFTSGDRIPKFDPLEGHLQDMLRVNMERYGAGAFDTIECARRVREVLSVHNIGQRLFAKYVLGLSQGTVSELLSKPKSWEKLTEKGRDSYRKMHAWVYDDRAVSMLKTLIPRKGELVRTGSFSSTALQNQLNSRDKDEFKRKFSPMNPSVSRIPENHHMEIPNVFGPHTPKKTFLNDLSNFKQAIELYNLQQSYIHKDEETAEQMTPTKSENTSRNSSPVISPGQTKADDRPEHQLEDSNLTENGRDVSDSKKGPDLELSNPCSPSAVETIAQNIQLVSPSKLLQIPTELPLHSLTPQLERGNPLQKIASITNSLEMKNQHHPMLPFPRFGQLPMRPYKTVLQPLNQSQVDRYEGINTEDVVRQVTI